jgi:P27 family predicted phage terminase small subunit
VGARGVLKLPNHLKPVQDPEAKPNSVADTARPMMPAKPEQLPPRVSELWDEIGAALDDNGLIAACDGPTLELALRHYLAAVAAADDLGEAPRLYDDKNERPMKNPSSQVFRDHSTAYLEYAKQLGMAFAARARIPAQKGDDGGGEENPFAAPGG